MNRKNKMTKNNKFNFKWNVWLWDINHEELETYDVIPIFISELDKLKNKDRPKTKEEFVEFLKREAIYYFWSKCEYEMLIKSWPKSEKEIKVDVYQQLELNWDIFVDRFWENLPKKYRKNI